MHTPKDGVRVKLIFMAWYTIVLAELKKNLIASFYFSFHEIIDRWVCKIEPVKALLEVVYLEICRHSTDIYLIAG